jgi:hypothetical protein
VSSNSNSEGAFNRYGYESALYDMRRTLNDLEVVGYPKRHRELIQLRDLLERYPAEAREILAELDSATDPRVTE